MPETRFRIAYVLTCDAGEDAAAKARGIAYEQTVELPESCVPEELRERIVGRVERVDPLGTDRSRAVISYPIEAVGEELPQALNLLFGNISLQRGILVRDVEWPSAWLERFAGPRFGIEGLRGLCGVTRRRPLLCAAPGWMLMPWKRMISVFWREAVSTPGNACRSTPSFKVWFAMCASTAWTPPGHCSGC